MGKLPPKMKEILYLEIPTTDTAVVKNWLQTEFEPGTFDKILTSDGIRLKPSDTTFAVTEITEKLPDELSVFVWNLQRTTYLS